MGATSKSGKSTLCANIAHSILLQGKKTLVITNEESSTDVLARVACLELGINFNKDKLGHTSEHDRHNVTKQIKEVAKLVDVAGKEKYRTWSTEVVRKILDKVVDDDYSVIMLDYFQLVSQSLVNPSLGYVEVLTQLAVFLSSFIKRSRAPLVVFAQLRDDGKVSEPFKNRIEHCKNIFNQATQIFELLKDGENLQSILRVVRSRFGDSESYYFGFDKGKLTSIDAPLVVEDSKENRAAELMKNRQKKKEDADAR